MIEPRIITSNCIICLPGDPIIAVFMRNGASLYRKSTSNRVYIVPKGKSHSEAWSLATERST